MRLRTFIAASIGEAMRQVRTALGEDAVILSTEQAGKQVKVTAAVEAASSTAAAPPIMAAASGELETALRYHGVPHSLASRLLATAGDLEGGSPQQALTAALRTQFGFQPLTDRKPMKPILLAGLPGAGKSSTLAKLAARAKVNGLAVTAITCDLAKAGAIEQLATYAKALEMPAYRAKDAATLRKAVAKADAQGVILIDTLGSNPLKAGDLAQLRALAEAARAEIVLVMAAGGDAVESAELAAGYAEVGATRLVATKVDVARRYGGLLAAAEAGRLAFAGVGTSPEIASGLGTLRADQLCRLILPASRAEPRAPGSAASKSPSNESPNKSPNNKSMSGIA
jgi:flagellar biosynthesis protein FlhF